MISAINNIIPRIRELELILKSPEVHGALISVLGENYFVHPHRYWHLLPPREDSPSDEDVAKAVYGGCHQRGTGPPKLGFRKCGMEAAEESGGSL